MHLLYGIHQHKHLQEYLFQDLYNHIQKMSQGAFRLPDSSALHEVPSSDYIQPHHQFFMAMGESFERKIELDCESDEIKKYLHGEEFDTTCENGWAVVTVNGCSLGGVKVVDGRAKNHYPKGLRLK